VAGIEREVQMLHKLLLVLAIAAFALPGAALAAKKPPKGYAVGQKCSAKYEKTYHAQHFTCVKGVLAAKK
jgi:hypothetical protein